jgi:hypothetical protein
MDAWMQNKVSGFGRRLKVLLKAREKQHAAEIAKLRRSHAAAVDRLTLENSQLCARVQRGVDEVRIRNGFDTKERFLLKRIRELEEEVSGCVGVCFFLVLIWRGSETGPGRSAQGNVGVGREQSHCKREAEEGTEAGAEGSGPV